VSQAAVSRQIRQLEERIQTRLFDRLHRSVALTPAGERLQQAVSYGFDQISDALARIEQENQGDRVGIAANNAVAFYWLRERIVDYQRREPSLEPAVYAADTDPPFGTEGIDLAVRYGNGQWGDARSTLLFRERLFPVCSPGYRDSVGSLAQPADLLEATLLYMDPQGPDWVTWAEWLRAQGIDRGMRLPQGPMFNSYPLLLEAAIDGQGVALGTGEMLDPLLEEGTLVRPMAAEYRTGRGYWLSLPAQGPLNPRAEALHDWLLSTVG
jgi:DNA-binding transcriptional LysR family regulator